MIAVRNQSGFKISLQSFTAIPIWRPEELATASAQMGSADARTGKGNRSLDQAPNRLSRKLRFSSSKRSIRRRNSSISSATPRSRRSPPSRSSRPSRLAKHSMPAYIPCVDEPRTVINLEDPVGKTVGRTRPPGDPLKAASELQRTATKLLKSCGHRMPPRGVFRFSSHEEADEWWTRNTTTNKTT